MLKSFKYELRPTEEQKAVLNGSIGSCRFIYNLALETKMAAYKAGKNLSGYDLMKQLTELKKDVPWLNDTFAKSLQHSIFDLDTAFNNFFNKKSGFPKFKNKGSKHSFKIPFGIKIDFSEWIVYVPKCGWISFNKDRVFDGEIRRATVSKSPTGRYFISILIKTDAKYPSSKTIKEDTTIGIDFGIKHLAVLSDGRKIDNPKYLIKSLANLRIAQRSLSRKINGSKRRENQKTKVAKLYEKIANQRNDFLHKLSTEIVNQYDSIAIESLNIKGMIKNRRLSKSISDSGWGILEGFLKYKSEWNGNNILQIGAFEPTSKRCSCGVINTDLTLSDREWTCVSCTQTHDRDILAANNIKQIGLRTPPSKRKREEISCASPV